MQDELMGFGYSPHRDVQAAFTEIAAGEMRDLPFARQQIPVQMVPFTLYEGQWLGCVLTPWMLSLLIFPGPQQCWPRRKISQRLGLKLPYGEMTFIVGELPGLGQYLSCSLLSPLPRDLSAGQGIQLAKDCLKMVLSLPVADETISRRRLLFGRQSQQHA